MRVCGVFPAGRHPTVLVRVHDVRPVDAVVAEIMLEIRRCQRAAEVIRRQRSSEKALRGEVPLTLCLRVDVVGSQRPSRLFDGATLREPLSAGNGYRAAFVTHAAPALAWIGWQRGTPRRPLAARVDRNARDILRGDATVQIVVHVVGLIVACADMLRDRAPVEDENRPPMLVPIPREHSRLARRRSGRRHVAQSLGSLTLSFDRRSQLGSVVQRGARRLYRSRAFDVVRNAAVVVAHGFVQLYGGCIFKTDCACLFIVAVMQVGRLSSSRVALGKFGMLRSVSFLVQEKRRRRQRRTVVCDQSSARVPEDRPILAGRRRQNGVPRIDFAFVDGHEMTALT